MNGILSELKSIKAKSQKTRIKELSSSIYFTSVKHIFNLASLTSRRKLLIINVARHCSIIEKNRTIAITPGVYTIYNEDIYNAKICISTLSKVLIIDLNSYGTLSNLRFPIGIHDCKHQQSIQSLLTLMDATDFSRGEIIAIIYLSSIPNKQTNVLLSKLCNYISRNHTNPHLHLTDVAKANYVSERKIQDILYKNHTSFSSLLKEYRYQSLLASLQNHANNISTASHIKKSGFPSYKSANEYFRKIHGMTLKSYILKLKINTN